MVSLLLCTELPFTNIFVAFGFGTWGTFNVLVEIWSE